MSKIKVNQVEQRSGATVTLGGGACKTAVVDATTVTLGRCGATVSLASGATQSGFGQTYSAVSWDTSSIKTATFTAAVGSGYFCNTSGGAFTVNLPAGAAGNVIAVKDYLNSFATYNLTVAPNGSEKIGGEAADMTLSTRGISMTLVYVDGTRGWVDVGEATTVASGDVEYMTATVSGACNTLTTSGDYKIAKFVGPGTFCVSAISTTSPPRNSLDYLVVAGAGGGQYGTTNVHGGGGGGGGGFRGSAGTSTGPYTVAPPQSGVDALTATISAYPITIGAGGVGGTSPDKGGKKGSNASFSTITSTGGGGGNGGANPCAPSVKVGGSGGGGPSDNSGAGGDGNSPPVTPSQGNPGGAGRDDPSPPTLASGGGGGATAAGAAATSSTGGAGGAGGTVCITASPVVYSKGGSGAGATTPGGTAGDSGAANTGNGGFGGVNRSPGGVNNGGAGGSGIVVIRYKYQN